MQKYLLLSELTDLEGRTLCHDIITMLFNISDFEYGRMYQLVIDRTKNLENKPSRRRKCGSYMKSKTKQEIIKEAYQITNIFRKKYKRKEYNEWFDLDIDHEGDFYLGRCIRFKQ